MVKFVISVAKGNRGEKRDGKHQTLRERPMKQQLYLAGFLTHAHHNLEENHSYLSQQLFKKDYSPHPPASVLPHRAWMGDGARDVSHRQPLAILCPPQSPV